MELLTGLVQGLNNATLGMPLYRALIALFPAIAVTLVVDTVVDALAGYIAARRELARTRSRRD